MKCCIDLKFASNPSYFLKKKAFPPTNEELEKIKGEEARLQKKEENEGDSNYHCIAWSIKCIKCIYQRIVGTSKYVLN